MRVLIVGEGKSGTTAVFRSVAAAIGNPAECFEPRDLRSAALHDDPLVAKKLLASWNPDEGSALSQFDRRVLILRDPRDRLISHMLYDAFNFASQLNTAQRDRWIRILERKVANPSEVSLIWVMDSWWKISKADLLGGYIRAMQRSNAFIATHGSDFHLMKYEEYVDADFSSLEGYLGLEIRPGEVKTEERRVSRRGNYGEWRQWFTDVDVNVFRPITARWLNRHGYNRDDWEIESGEAIDPSTSIDYVRSLFDGPGSPRNR